MATEKSDRTRLILVLSAAVACYLLLMLFAFSVSSWNDTIAKKVILALLVLGIAPIYPLFRMLGKRPRLSAIAILLVIAAVICGLASLTGSVFFHVDKGWVSVTSTLSQGLFLSSCLLFIWNGFV